jgi:hypothetical protein
VTEGSPSRRSFNVLNAQFLVGRFSGTAVQVVLGTQNS